MYIVYVREKEYTCPKRTCTPEFMQSCATNIDVHNYVCIYMYMYSVHVYMIVQTRQRLIVLCSHIGREGFDLRLSRPLNFRDAVTCGLFYLMWQQWRYWIVYTCIIIHVHVYAYTSCTCTCYRDTCTAMYSHVHVALPCLFV